VNEKQIPDVDAKLESSASQLMGRLVQDLPEDVPSMAWRSQLNERLLAEANVKPRKSVWNWMLKPALGVSMATALALVVIVKFQPAEAPTAGGLESELLAAHQAESRLANVTGVGLSVGEIDSYANPTPLDSEIAFELDVL